MKDTLICPKCGSDEIYIEKSCRSLFRRIKTGIDADRYSCIRCGYSEEQELPRQEYKLRIIDRWMWLPTVIILEAVIAIIIVIQDCG